MLCAEFLKNLVPVHMSWKILLSWTKWRNSGQILSVYIVFDSNLLMEKTTVGPILSESTAAGLKWTAVLSVWAFVHRQCTSAKSVCFATGRLRLLS